MKTTVVMTFAALLTACGSVAPADEDAGPSGDGNSDSGCQVDDDCGAHEVCEPSGACACGSGYTLSDNGCQWSGVIADPGFQDPTAWTVEGSIAVRPESAGNADAGDMFFDSDAVCAMNRATQRVLMPALDRAEPLVVELIYQGGVGGFESEYPASPALGINGAWIPLGRDYPQMGDSPWITQRVCLGEAAYGGEVEFGLAINWAYPECQQGTTEGTLIVDRFAIVPAEEGECPPPGQVRGGDFESDRWSFSAPPGGLAGYMAAVGENGTRGARLSTPACQSPATMQTLLSVPSSMNAPALKLWWRGEFRAAVSLTLLSPYAAQGRTLGHEFARLSGTAGEKVTTICLPQWSHGHAVPLTVSVGDLFPCQSDAQSVDFDTLELVEEPACAELEAIADGSFEGRAGSAAQTLLMPWSSYEPGTARVAYETSAELANTGTGVARLTVANVCQDSRLQTSFAVPGADPTQGGPALQFFYNLGPSPSTSFLVRDSLKTFEVAIPDSAGWTKQTACIDPALAGRPMTATFVLRGNGGVACNTAFPQETTLVDDVTVGLDPVCPGQ